MFQSSFTVVGDTPSTVAVSPMVRPLKQRILLIYQPEISFVN
jgi:hypothetical protein